MSDNTTRIRGVPVADRARSTTARPAGLLSGLDDDAFDEQMATWRRERQEQYEVEQVLDRELGLSQPEVGRDVYMAACRDLKAQGLDPDSADAKTLLAAMRRHSS